jgi:hypothetical protein
MKEISSEARPKKWSAPATKAASAPGKFWANGSESDSDCEDLGDADAIAKVCSSVDVGTQRCGWMEADPPTAAVKDRNALPPQSGKNKASKKTEMQKAARGVRWPWCKTWKGPLPPPRMSPWRTIGDLLLPAIQLADGIRRAVSAPDPNLPSAGAHGWIQIPNHQRLRHQCRIRLYSAR